MTSDDIIRLAYKVSDGVLSYDAEGRWILSEQEVIQLAALVAAEKDREIKRLQDMLYEQLGELTALRAEKQMRGYIEQLKEQPR